MTGRSRAIATRVCVCFLMLGAVAAGAQEVRWSPPDQLGLGQIGKIDLVFEGCAPVGDVEWPTPPELEVVGEPTESRVFSMVNFETRTSVTLGFPVRARESGVIELPSFPVETDEGTFLVPKSRVAVGAATLPGARGRPEPISEVAGASLEIGDRMPYVGEVVDLRFDVAVDERRSASMAGPLRWDPAPMLIEAWGQPEQTRFDRRNGVRQYTRGTFPEPGPFVLAPAVQDLNIEVGQGGVGLFRNRRMRTISVETEPLRVEVQPLPTPAPLGFEGAVGRFRLESKLVPDQARVGEPLTWSLSLSGEGNWPDGVGLPARAVPRDIEVIRPHATRQFEEGALFEGRVSEDLVLIPTTPGPLELAPVRFVYFDPERGRYETLEAAVEPLVVAPAATGSRSQPPALAPAPAPSVPATRAAPEAGADGDAPSSAPDVSLLPGRRQEPRLPREPLAGVPARPRPWSAPASPLAWAGWLLAGFLPVAFIASWLGRRRAVRHDALQARRAALARVDAVLEALSQTAPADADARAARLLEWQRASACALGHTGEAPTLAALEARRWGDGDGASWGVDATGWRQLWREADHALYDADRAWPADWVERARRARSALRIVGVPWATGLRWRHLWPVLIVWVCVDARPVAADEPMRVGLDAYATGDFEAAARAFGERAAAEPLDWKARSDLGLARLQQGDVEGALVESVAAWVLQPRDEALRWNLAVAARRAGWIDPALRDLAWGDGRFALARLASPGAWQAVGVATAWLGWGALAWAFVRRHRGRPVRGALVGAGVAALATGVAAFMWATWGALGERSASIVRRPAMLRSLPTELASEPIEVALEAGRVVVVERAFLGWLSIRLANGDVGWVRSDSVSPIYLSVPAPGEPWPDAPPLPPATAPAPAGPAPEPSDEPAP